VPCVFYSRDGVFYILYLYCSCKIAPIFTLSCVTGENLNLLTSFLNTVPPPQFPPDLQQHPSEFHVDEIFNVPEVGLVLGGILSRGVVRVDDPVLVGPSEDGQFVHTTVATIRRNRTPCRVARAGEAVTVTLADYERDDVRKVNVRAGRYVRKLVVTLLARIYNRTL